MPMVINYLRIQADLERAKEILTAIAEKKQGLGSMDFNAITPEPAWVYQGAVDHAARKEFGPENCWDLWRRKNWNTLYNAAVPKSRARSYGGGNLICFETRDTPIEMLIRKLSLIYPDVYGTIAIRGIRVVEGKNGLFVSMPGSWNRKNEYMDTVFPVTKQAHEELYEAVMQAYKQHLEQNNSGPKMQM